MKWVKQSPLFNLTTKKETMLILLNLLLIPVIGGLYWRESINYVKKGDGLVPVPVPPQEHDSFRNR